jgi:hypothetical protein
MLIICILLIPLINAQYWEINERGFLPKNKIKSCKNNYLKDFCNILRTNSSTELIEEEASKIDISNIYSEYLEDTFHWFSVATCRIGYNQNPKGDNINKPIIIPKKVSSRLLALAKLLEREPTTGYASLVLDNCELIEEFNDKYENWNIQRTVTMENEELAHRTEKGFYAAHCSVEYTFGNAISNIMEIYKLAELEDFINFNGEYNKMNLYEINEIIIVSNITEKLRELAYNVRKTINSLKQMRHYFNSENFFSKLRPYLKCGNIGENGIIFESDDISEEKINIKLPNGTKRTIKFNEPIFGFRGPTGAQTPSLIAIDAGLQIITSINSDKNLKITMEEFAQYQPIEHYYTINLLKQMKLRDFIIKISNKNIIEINGLIDAYNDAVISVTEFRFAHIDNVQTYIYKSISKVHEHDITGTGNTQISTYLCKNGLGTLNSLIKNNYTSNNLPQISIPIICVKECIKNNLYEIHTREYCNNINEYIE